MTQSRICGLRCARKGAWAGLARPGLACAGRRPLGAAWAASIVVHALVRANMFRGAPIIDLPFGYLLLIKLLIANYIAKACRRQGADIFIIDSCVSALH